MKKHSIILIAVLILLLLFQAGCTGGEQSDPKQEQHEVTDWEQMIREEFFTDDSDVGRALARAVVIRVEQSDGELTVTVKAPDIGAGLLSWAQTLSDGDLDEAAMEEEILRLLKESEKTEQVYVLACDGDGADARIDYSGDFSAAMTCGLNRELEEQVKTIIGEKKTEEETQKETEAGKTEPEISYEDPAQTVQAVNALLAGVRFYPDSMSSQVSRWTDQQIRDGVYSKLLRIDDDKDPAWLQRSGVSFRTEDWQWRFDLADIQKITMDTYGREFPTDGGDANCYVSGDALIISPADGESTEHAVQYFEWDRDTLVAWGIVVHHYNNFSEFRAYFQATLKKNPDSIYGYTLTEMDYMDGNQRLDDLYASASSALEDTDTASYGPRMVMDGDITTAWVEGVDGTGVSEWIQLERTGRSRMEIAALTLYVGYQKNEDILQKNGWPCKLMIECENGYRQMVELYGYTDTILLDHPVTTGWIRLTVVEAQPGYKYEDTCISEIRVLGLDSSKLSAGGR